jgi:hypothetical protein
MENFSNAKSEEPAVPAKTQNASQLKLEAPNKKNRGPVTLRKSVPQTRRNRGAREIMFNMAFSSSAGSSTSVSDSSNRSNFMLPGTELQFCAKHHANV